MSKSSRKLAPIPLLALVLAWLVPGAGHVYVGRTVRGAIIFLAVTLMFWAGMAMGGVMTMDYQSERWWFAADMMTGVNGVIGWHNQQKVYAKINPSQQVLTDSEIDKRLRKEGVVITAPTDTISRAYCGVAGLLNVMCMFDAVMLCLMRKTGEEPDDEASKVGGGETK